MTMDRSRFSGETTSEVMSKAEDEMSRPLKTLETRKGNEGPWEIPQIPYRMLGPPDMFVGLETMIPPMNTTVSIVLSSSI